MSSNVVYCQKITLEPLATLLRHYKGGGWVLSFRNFAKKGKLRIFNKKERGWLNRAVVLEKRV